MTHRREFQASPSRGVSQLGTGMRLLGGSGRRRTLNIRAVCWKTNLKHINGRIHNATLLPGGHRGDPSHVDLLPVFFAPGFLLRAPTLGQKSVLTTLI